MKHTLTIVGVCFAIAVFLCAVMIRQRSVLPPSGMGEHFIPHLISDEAWRQSIANDPTAHGYSGYGFLTSRESDIAIDEGLRDLESEDPYVWVNAASYLGSRGRSEAIPFLIKSLRHTAWRADDERLELLKDLTGQSFGNDFRQWLAWYESQPEQIQIDWTSNLGHQPRIGMTNQADRGVSNLHE